MVKVKKTNLRDGYDNPFPKRLRKLLEERKMSQEDLASIVGVARQSIASWKDGKTIPDINSLKEIATCFKVSTDYLLGITKEESPIIEVQAMHEMTGLTGDAIENLYRFNKDHSDVINHLNMLLENRDIEFLLSAIGYLEYATMMRIVSGDKFDFGWGGDMGYGKTLNYAESEVFYENLLKDLFVNILKDSINSGITETKLKEYAETNKILRESNKDFVL